MAFTTQMATLQERNDAVMDLGQAGITDKPHQTIVSVTNQHVPRQSTRRWQLLREAIVGQSCRSSRTTGDPTTGAAVEGASSTEAPATVYAIEGVKGAVGALSKQGWDGGVRSIRSDSN